MYNFPLRDKRLKRLPGKILIVRLRCEQPRSTFYRIQVRRRLSEHLCYRAGVEAEDRYEVCGRLLKFNFRIGVAA